jgi:peptidoglycan/LPS O-acetylase OafA/YrhL
MARRWTGYCTSGDKRRIPAVPAHLTVRSVHVCDIARGARKVNAARPAAPAHRRIERARIMKYRTDIDGLRALAVVPVVLYHAGVSGFGGGFVGVDIFFVISGYLICGMIDEDIRKQTFSIGNFYKRRVMRILPALFAMFLATSCLAYIYFLPVELKDYAKSLASAVGSVSNVYFAEITGYFDAPAETKPLLHTWSLGVEEQFYLFTPLLMLFVYRFFPKRTK